MPNHESLWGGPDPLGGAPPPGPPCVPIWRPTWGEEVSGTVCCVSHVVVWSHWSDARREVCTLDTGRCLRCDLGKSKRWEAWLAVRPHDRPGLRLVPVTRAAADHTTLPQFKDEECSWLGWRVKLLRLGRAKTAPERIFGDPPRDGAGLPPAWAGMAATLRRVYRVESPGEASPGKEVV